MTDLRPGLLLLGLGLMLSGCGIVGSESFPPTNEPEPQAVETPENAKPDTAPGSAGVDQELVREMQENLNALGYQAGTADGVIGKRTRGALEDFRKSEGFDAESQFSDQVLGRLRFRVIEKRNVEGEEARLYAAVPPLYQVGSSYVYSDGSVETVTGVKGDLVRWTGEDGSRFTTRRSFFVPPVYWERQTQSGSTRLDQESSHWLQEVGQETDFVAHTTIKQGEDGGTVLEETRARWRCRAVERERLTALIGTFDTLKVACDSKAGKAGDSVHRIWHYARGLDHYLYRSEGSDPARAAELIAIRPRVADWPPIARAALGRAIEWALTTTEDGQALPWSSSAVEVKVTIAINRSYRDQEGTDCRTFFQIWTDARGKRIYPGVACQGSAGAWNIPGVESPSGMPTAISEWMS